MALYTPDRLSDEVHSALDRARERRESLTALPADASAATVLAEFDHIRRELDECGERAGTFSSVHPDKPVRDMAETLEQELVAFDTELSLDRGIYDRLAALDPATLESPEEVRLLEYSLRDFRRSGVDKDEATRKRVRELQRELIEIGQTFDRNIVEATVKLRFEDGHAALAGLPADFLATHPEADDGSVTITTDPPDYLPCMLYAERDDVRKRLYLEFMNRAYPQNLAVLDELLAKRHELATLLGYESWAEYVTEDKMVRNPGTVRSFIERVSELARARAAGEYADLLADKRSTEPAAESVNDWERGHRIERVKRERFGFDSQSVRPYFAYGRVKQGLFDTSAALYGVEFRRDENAEAWHETVECYEILDGGEPIARFKLDMFPREGKFKHAAMFSMRHGILGEVLPEAALVCNFPEPSEDDPALLMHSQVTTFFHEFGHLLHHLFAGRGRFLRFSGINTEWDFVEVPSQLYEEWAWDPAVLATFAHHHETGEPIPAELVRQLREAEEYGKGIQVATQMCYSAISLSYYEQDPTGLDTTARMVELKESMTPFAYVPETHFQAAFGHLHGYSAIYYTYMWSLVISKDLFGAYDQGPMDPARADAYRRAVLEPGGRRDAADLVSSFLGREYDFAAWEAWLRE